MKELHAKILCVLMVTCFMATATAAPNDDGGQKGAPGNTDKGNAPAAYAVPELPRAYVDTSYPAKTGTTINVNSGGDLQSAIDGASLGDEIVVQAGATFEGPITLPKKTGSGWIVIRTSDMAGLPPEGTRVAPSDSGSLPKIVAPNSDNAVNCENGAHHYYLVGIEMTVAGSISQVYALMDLSGQNPTTRANLPNNITLTRCYIHGDETSNVRRGIALNSAWTAVVDSYISDCHEVGADSQAIGGWTGSGPYNITNNFLSGAGENFMLGGSDPSITNLVPSDIEFRKNHVYKPMKWKSDDPGYIGVDFVIKNSFELKNAVRTLADGNTFENNWADAQDGFAIVMTVRNQEGTAPWSNVSDVTFINNVVKNSACGINFLGSDDNYPSQVEHRLMFYNNLWQNMASGTLGSKVFMQVGHGPVDVIFEHNTVIIPEDNGNIMSLYSDLKAERFTFRNNIISYVGYGLFGDGGYIGTDGLNQYCTNWVFEKNAIFGGGNPSDYPANNWFPADINAVGFTDAGTGNYRLLNSSAYHNAATDGKDVGFLYDEQVVVPETGIVVPTVACAATALMCILFGARRRRRP